MSEHDQQRDIERLLGRLQGPEPEARPAPVPEAWPASRSVILAAAAALLVAVGGLAGWQGHEHYATTRGVEDAAVSLDLRMVVERDGQAIRVHSGAEYSVGERAFFRIAASRQADVTLWVEGPDGRQQVGHFAASPELQDLSHGDGLLAWEFDQPGAYVFVLAEGEVDDCEPELCPRVSLEVR